MIKTYYRYESDNHIYKYTWTYDGYKETGYKRYYDGQLYEERNNYSYNGLTASWDSYSYQNGDVNTVTVQHIECEYLDETFQRKKYVKECNSQNNNIYETYYEYEGKKMLGYTSYTNGILGYEMHYNYDGLRRTYKTTYYYGSSNVIQQERSYEIVYLDDSYLRQKSLMQTRKNYDIDGNLTSSWTSCDIYEYDGKKPIGFQHFMNGKLGYICRDYQYDGLTCYYFKDIYRDGEVYSTSIEEVEYLE